MKDMTKAQATAGSTSSHGICTLPIKERAANAVPQAEASLLVPSKEVEAMFGIRLNRAGSCISPPPPTAASIRPAKKANRHSREMVNMRQSKNSGKDASIGARLCDGCSYACNSVLRKAQSGVALDETGMVRSTGDFPSEAPCHVHETDVGNPRLLQRCRKAQLRPCGPHAGALAVGRHACHPVFGRRHRRR